MKYDWRNDTSATEEDCRNEVGRSKTLSLTGKVVGYEVSAKGPYIQFAPDERYGFGGLIISCDLEVFDD